MSKKKNLLESITGVTFAEGKDQKDKSLLYTTELSPAHAEAWQVFFDKHGITFTSAVIKEKRTPLTIEKTYVLFAEKGHLQHRIHTLRALSNQTYGLTYNEDIAQENNTMTINAWDAQKHSKTKLPKPTLVTPWEVVETTPQHAQQR